MAKDPAILFYYEAFSNGTQFMTDEEVGKYIRLLIYQFDKGHIPLELVLRICKASAFEDVPRNIQEKIKIDENGDYFNYRADVEKEKRVKFIASRKKNASTSLALAELDINKDININISKLLLNNIIKRKPDFKNPDILKWAEHIEKMIRIDKRDAEEIKSVISWCQNDDFWKDNILSTSKLRIQYDQLVLKMRGKNAKHNNSRKTWESPDEKRDAVNRSAAEDADEITRRYQEKLAAASGQSKDVS